MSQVAKVIGVCMTLAACNPLHVVGTGNLVHSVVTGNTQGVATGLAGKAIDIPNPFENNDVEHTKNNDTVHWTFENTTRANTIEQLRLAME